MTTERRPSGFGQGFSKEVDSILTAYSMGVVYQDEVRENLRLAGMLLNRESEMPDFASVPYDPGEEPPAGPSEGETDEQ